MKAHRILRDLIERSRKPLFLHRVEREPPLANLADSRDPDVASRFAS
jgi:hypothetical protein